MKEGRYNIGTSVYPLWKNVDSVAHLYIKADSISPINEVSVSDFMLAMYNKIQNDTQKL